jgi:hypothetical protein
LPNGWSGTSTSNLITATVDTSSGSVSVSVSDACGTSMVQSLAITTIINCCIPPATITQIPNANAGELSISWPILNGLNHYLVQWRKFGATAFFEDTVSTSSKTITGLSVGSVYQIRARTLCGISQSDWTRKTYNLISGGPVACENVVGLSVVGTTSNSVSLSWNAVVGASSYEIKYRQSGPGNLEQRISSATNSITIIGLNNSSQYYFYVLSNCTNSLSLNWSFIAARTTQIAINGGTISRLTNQNNFISIYPNPTKLFTNVVFENELTENTTMSLYSLDGKLVSTGIIAKGTKAKELNTAMLSAGMYFVRLYNSSINYQHKLVIEE